MRTTVRWTRASWAAVAVSVLVGGAPASRGDVFLLADGARVRGELAEEFKGPDRKPWLRVRTSFGTTQFPKKSLRKQLKAGSRDGALTCESIVVTTLMGDVARSGDEGRNWTAISPRSRDGRTVDDLPVNLPNSIVAPGHEVRTGPDGEVDLDLGWGVVHVAPSSRVAFRTSGGATMTLLRGAAGARLDELPAGGEFRVETAQASMGVRGTTFAVRLVGSATRLAVREGRVAVGDLTIGAGSAVEVSAGGATRETAPDATDAKLFQRLRATFAIPRIDRVRVPAGRLDFEAGSETVPIDVPVFELARHEITNEQFRVFQRWIETYGDHYFCHPQEPAGATHRTFQLGRRGTEAPELDRWRQEYFHDDEQPAVGVSWFTAYAFCAWVGGYLPSRTKWRWASHGASRKPDLRAGTILAQSWLLSNSGELQVPDGRVPWPEDFGRIVRTHPVATRAPNRLGLHDMFGNASEWLQCSGNLDVALLPRDGSPFEAPRGSGPAEPGTDGGVRFVVGGSYATPLVDLNGFGQQTFALGAYPEVGIRPEFRDR